MKTKAERFIDQVQSVLIQSKHTGAYAPAMWSLLRELEQASRAAIHIPESLSAEEAAQQFVSFLYEVDSLAPDPADAPDWLRSYVIGELELSVSERLP